MIIILIKKKWDHCDVINKNFSYDLFFHCFFLRENLSHNNISWAYNLKVDILLIVTKIKDFKLQIINCFLFHQMSFITFYFYFIT